MARPLSLLLAAAAITAGLALFPPAVRAADSVLTPPTDDQALIAAFKDLLHCESKIAHLKIPANARLLVTRGGKTEQDESLEGFQDLTIITLTGPGIAATPPTATGPTGYRVILIGRSGPAPISGDKLTGHMVQSRTWQAAYTEPSGEHNGITLYSGATPIFSRIDRENGTKKDLDSLKIEITTATK